MSTPRISVLMPVYNASRFLREAVESILAQSFADFELIAVNDGSTDSSLEILQKTAGSDQRVRILSRANTGIVGALNDGIALARGEFIARMDADDIARPERFERQIAYMSSHPDCVVVGSSVVIMDESGNEIYVETAPASHSQIEEILLTGNGSICHPTVMMRADAVRRVGGYRSKCPAEDMDLFLRLGETGRLANIEDPLLFYRWHLKSICHQINQAKANRVRLEVANDARRRRGIPDRELRQCSAPDTQLNEQNQVIEHYRRWSYEASKAGRSRISRKYALVALRLDPLQKKSWWTLCNSLMGRRLTTGLARIYTRLRFWR